MIYLIDDKKIRQEDLGWNEEKVNIYSDKITFIYEAKNLDWNEIFQEDNIIMFHESFYENSNNIKENIVNIIERISSAAHKYKNLRVVIFSGGMSSTYIEKNNKIARLPVYTLYSNLEEFITNPNELKTLLYGKNNIEELLLKEFEKAKLNIYDDTSNDIINTNNLLVLDSKSNLRIDNIINAKTIDLFFDYDKSSPESDKVFHDLVNQWVGQHVYDNIFIPLSFGQNASDFNGLRYAAHILFSNTENARRNIFIYSPVEMDYLINHKYFDILKCKNVELIEIKKSKFIESVNKPIDRLSEKEFQKELTKIKLDLPDDYDSNHSIINEWAISRYSKFLNISDDNEINKIAAKIKHNLYFKYFNAIGNIYNANDEEFNFNVNVNDNVKILYIDDEAEKGWIEILWNLIDTLEDEKNKIHLEYLDKLKGISPTEIIDKSLKEIEKEKYTTVILDFRLHEKDHRKNLNPKEVTGLRLLQEIKKFNRGIQVIILSATSNLNNLQLLQDNGADRFVIKESPELSQKNNFTSDNFIKLTESIQYTINRVFLYEVFELVSLTQSKLGTISLIKYCKPPNSKFQELAYKTALKDELELFFDSLYGSSKNKFINTINITYRIFHAIIEIFIDNTNNAKFNNVPIKFKSSKELFLFTKAKEKHKQIKNDTRLRNQYYSQSNILLNIIDSLNCKDKNTTYQIRKFYELRNDYIHNKKTVNIDAKDSIIWLKLIHKIFSAM